MEMEFFVPPAEADEWYATGSTARSTGTALRLRESNLRVREHDADERSHYSSATSDIEYLYPIGWSELEGVANRGDYDLTQHTQLSGRSSSGSARTASATRRT
jgi:glycyl-tRNA synthetase